MKKIIFTLVVALMVGTFAQAQSQPESYFSTRVGVNFSNLVDDIYESDFQSGFNASVLYNYSLMSSVPLYLQSGLGVTMKGGRNNKILSGGDSAHLKTYAFNIPLVLVYEMVINKQMSVIPEVGVYYSYAFCGSLSSDEYFYRPFKKQMTEVPMGDGVESVDTRLLHRSDFGIRAGLSLRVAKYTVGVAYDAGVVNYFAKDFRDAGADVTTGCWSTNLGYLFR